MDNRINELIEQIGGRKRLEDIVYAMGVKPCGAEPSDADQFLDSIKHGDIGKMDLALLAVLDARPVGTVSIAMDWSTHRNIATVNMRPDLVLSEMRDGDNLYTTPPAASAPGEMTPEMMRAVQLKSELGAYAAANLGGAHGLFDEFWKVAMAAAPAPEDKK